VKVENHNYYLNLIMFGFYNKNVINVVSLQLINLSWSNNKTVKNDKVSIFCITTQSLSDTGTSTT